MKSPSSWPFRTLKGVGKSTIACHTAQYLALQGYRVCLIDCDSQASSTTMFGLNPDLDLHQEDTLHPFLMLGDNKPCSMLSARPTGMGYG